MDRKKAAPGFSVTLLCSNGGRFFLLFMMIIFSIRVMSQDIITAHPADNSRCAGFPIYFSVEPRDAPDYQWQVNKNDGAGFTDIAGAKGYSYGDINTKAQLSMNGYLYRVIVKNTAGTSQTSTAAKLTVNPTPAIERTPISTTVCEKEEAAFSVSATGSGTLSYRWFQKPPSGSYTVLSGINFPTLRLPNVSLGMAGYQYWVEVSDGSCLITTKSDRASEQAFLRVTPAPSLTINNPAAACNSSSTTSTVDLTLSAVTEGSTSGLAFSYFTDMAATAALNQPNAVTRSGTYYIRGTKGGCNTELKPVLVTINVAPGVSVEPQELVCSGGETGIILTDPNNAGNKTLFKWTVSNNTNITGASGQTSPAAGLIIQKLTNAASSAQTITYTITPVASPCPDGSPVAVPVEVSTVPAPTPDLTLDPSAVSVCSGESFSAGISPSGAQYKYKWTFLPFNDNVTGGRSQGALSPGPVRDKLTSTASTNQTATYLVTAYDLTVYCAGSRKKLDVTVKPQPVVKATPAEVAICSGGSTDVVLEDASGMQGTEYKWEVSTSSTALDIQGQSRTTAGAGPMTVKPTNSSATTEKATYTVTPVAANGCSGTPLPVPVSVSPPSVKIAEQPSSKTLCVGDKLELTVKAETNTVTYQWKKNGSAIAGATNASYAIEALAAADAGKYKAEVSAGGCISPSAEAEVIVKEGASFFETATPTVSSHAIDYMGYVDFEYTGPEAVLEWKFGDQTGSPMAKVRHYYYKAATFSVELTAKRNSSCSKSFTVGEIRVGGTNVELVTAGKTREGLTFFPNPVRDRLYLKSEDTLQSATLFDAMGKEVMTFVLEGKEDALEVEALPPGLYVIRVKTQRERINLKLMKQ